MRRDTVLAFAFILLVLAALAAKSMLVSVPPLRAHNAPGEFDAARAKARLAMVLGDQRPHPVDSAADDMVRARLAGQLQYMGLKPIVRDQVVCNDFAKNRLVACARVRNVIAVVRPAAGKALLLSAHYDSVPVGPGASDDGIGVATLLEVGSILKDRPLPRPVILLFNEGEELGLLGARAFLADPLSGNVDSALNFDARGVTGPVTMFQTSQPNGGAVAVFARSARRPVASSLSTDVARLIPNDTDMTVYNERGWVALNFAIMGNETRYHSPGDDLAGLDTRSLQHMGDQALAAAVNLSNGPPQAQGNRIFFDVLGRAFVAMPMAVGLALFLPLLGIFGFIGWRRGALIGATPLVLGAMISGGVVAWLATVLVAALRAGTYWRAHQEIAFVAIYATVAFGALAVLRIAGSSFSTTRLRASCWLAFLLIGGALAIAAPGAIIYFLIPPAIVLLGMAAARWYRPAETVGGLAALLLLYLTWGEMLAQLEELFTPGPLWVAAPVGAIMIVAALIEAHALLIRVSRPVLLLGSAAIAAVAWTAAGVAPAYSRDHQERFTIEHVTQFPSGQSYWSVLNDGSKLPTVYSTVGRWRLGTLPFSERKRWFAPAPSAPGIKPPSLELLETVRNGTERRIRLRLHANSAERLLLIAPEDAHLRTAGATGLARPIVSADSSGKFAIACSGRSCDGMELTIDQGKADPTIFTLVGSRNGLPPAAAQLVRARPQFARPQYTPDESVAIARIRL